MVVGAVYVCCVPWKLREEVLSKFFLGALVGFFMCYAICLDVVTSWMVQSVVKTMAMSKCWNWTGSSS